MRKKVGMRMKSKNRRDEQKRLELLVRQIARSVSGVTTGQGLRQRLGFIALLVLTLTMWLSASEAYAAVSDLRNRAPITWSASPTNYSLLEIPDEVISQTQKDYPDLRIYSGTEEIPYALLNEQELNPPQLSEPASLSNRGIDAQGNLVFELNNPQGKALRQIRWFTRDKNFIRRLRVEGSHDRRDWIVLSSNSIIFDLAQKNANSHLEVELSDSNFPVFRVTVFREGNGEFNPERAELVFTNSLPTKEQLKDRSYDSEMESTKDNIQIYTFDLKSNLPTKEIEFISDQQNFNRRVEVLTSDNKKDWKLIVQGEIYAFSLGQISAKQQTLKFFGAQRYLKLRVYNQDNLPLKITEIKIRGVNPVVVFASTAEKPTFLYWNSNQLKAPSYDIQRFKGNLDFSKLSWASLGAAEQNQEYKFVDTRPWTERNDWLLKAILIVVVGVLLLLVGRSLTKIAKEKPPQNRTEACSIRERDGEVVKNEE